MMINLIFNNKITFNVPPWKRGLGRSIINLKKNPPGPLFKKGRNFLLFIFVLILSECSSPSKYLSKVEYSQDQIKNIPYSLPFLEKTLIYKTDINFYKNDISGLLIIKKTSENIYRIALTTQFGLKIFDFELNHGALKVKYCIESLNKKLIIKTFENDFNILLMQIKAESISIIENTEQKQRIWQFKSGKLITNYIQNNESEKIENINVRKRNSEKISVGLYGYKENIPGNITLEHKNIKLKINLKLIQ